ncbi:MAG: hypothetical protein GXY76_06660 [Chloroflexi bacterium]|nr:hypothetical protein [Chloroflexota bacterium]
MNKAELVAAKVTPERVARLVYALEPQQHPANRGSVSIGQLIDALLAQEGYAAEERAPFEVALTQAIVQAAKDIPGFEFVDGG